MNIHGYAQRGGSNASSSMHFNTCATLTYACSQLLCADSHASLLARCQARARFLDLAANRRVEIDKPDISAHYHLSSSSSPLPNSGITKASSPWCAISLLASAQPLLMGLAGARTTHHVLPICGGVSHELLKHCYNPSGTTEAEMNQAIREKDSSRSGVMPLS